MSAEATTSTGEAPRPDEWPVAPTDPARLLPLPSPSSYEEHLARYGARPTASKELIEAVARAGLRGHGGAGFPTATKLQAVARRRRPVVVANGTEGEPASAKDKVLLTVSPHLVLDGVLAASEVLNAREQWLCIDRSWSNVVASVEAALAQRRGREAALPSCRVVGAPDGYVTGEESALVNWISGNEAKPTFTPPRPFERGVRGRPTFVSNVETFADLALISRFGPDWFRTLGSAEAPGTMLVTVTGGVARPGVCEIEGGVDLLTTIAAAGGAVSGVAAVLVGGYFGTWIEGGDVERVRLDPLALAGFGAGLGCGALFVLPNGACPLQEVARVTRWMAGQSAGQCGPCLYGLDRVAAIVEAVAAGHAGALGNLDHYLALVRGRGACRHPDGVARFVDSSRRIFASHVAQHERFGACPPQAPLLPTPSTGGWR